MKDTEVPVIQINRVDEICIHKQNKSIREAASCCVEEGGIKYELEPCRIFQAAENNIWFFRFIRVKTFFISGNSPVFAAENKFITVMFSIFKQDVKAGDKVKQSLITGKEPEGAVLETGDNFVLLESDNKIKSRLHYRL